MDVQAHYQALTLLRLVAHRWDDLVISNSALWTWVCNSMDPAAVQRVLDDRSGGRALNIIFRADPDEGYYYAKPEDKQFQQLVLPHSRRWAKLYLGGLLQRWGSGVLVREILASEVPLLDTLEIDDAFESGIIIPDTFFRSNRASLTKLSLNGRFYRLLDVLPLLSGLQSLSLDGRFTGLTEGDSATPWTYEWIKALPSLQHLSVAGRTGFSEPSEANADPYFGDLPSILTLKCSGLGSIAVARLLHHVSPNAQRLDITYTHADMASTTRVLKGFAAKAPLWVCNAPDLSSLFIMIEEDGRFVDWYDSHGSTHLRLLNVRPIDAGPIAEVLCENLQPKLCKSLNNVSVGWPRMQMDVQVTILTPISQQCLNVSTLDIGCHDSWDVMKLLEGNEGGFLFPSLKALKVYLESEGAVHYSMDYRRWIHERNSAESTASIESLTVYNASDHGFVDVLQGLGVVVFLKGSSL